MATDKKKRLTSNEKLGKQIRKLRKRKGLTQEDLAGATGKSVTWIAYIENGYKRPNILLLTKIARVLGVKVKDIFTF